MWPKNRQQDADVEQVAAPAQAGRAQQLRGVALPACTGRGQTATSCQSRTRPGKYRDRCRTRRVQAVVHDVDSLWCPLGVGGYLNDMHGLRPAEAWPEPGLLQHVKGLRLAQASSISGSGGVTDCTRCAAATASTAASHAGIGAVACLTSALKTHVAAMWAISPRNRAGRGSARLGRGELQQHRQVIGQLVGAQLNRPASRRSGIRSIMAGPRSRESPCTCSNRCSEVAVAAVEGVHVAGFDCRQVGAARCCQQRLRSTCARRSAPASAQGIAAKAVPRAAARRGNSSQDSTRHSARQRRSGFVASSWCSLSVLASYTWP